MNLAKRLQFSAMMFAQYFIWGAWFVTLGTYMSKGLHFDRIIGLTYSAQGIGAILAPLFVGTIADRMFSAQRVMGVLHLLGAGIMCWVSTITTDANLFFIGILAYFSCFMPTLALSNAVVFNGLTDTTKQFPAIRVFGTLGWIVAGLIVGSIAGAAETRLPMQIAAGASLVLGLYAFTLPDTPPRAKGQPLKILGLFGLDLVAGMRDRSFWIMIVCSLLIVVPLSFYYAYANTFFVDIDAKAVFAGHTFEPAAVQTLGQVSEFLFMLLLPLFFRLGLKWVLIVGMAGWALRYVLFAFGFDAHGAIMSFILAGILLHGLCYDFFFVAGQIYVDQVFRIEQRARAQSFMALITLGIGNVIGSDLAGVVYDHYSTATGGHDWKMVWLVPAIVAIGVLALFLLAFRPSRSATPATA